MMKIKSCSDSILWSGDGSTRPMKTGGHSFNIFIGYNFAFKNGYGGWIDLFRHQDYLTEQFNLSDDVFFPTGPYNYYNFETGFTTPANK
jgi:hypothetical protein